MQHSDKDSLVKDVRYSKYRFPLATVMNPVFGRFLGTCVNGKRIVVENSGRE